MYKKNLKTLRSFLLLASISIITGIFAQPTVTILVPFSGQDTITAFLDQIINREYFEQSEIVFISNDAAIEQQEYIRQYQQIFSNITMIVEQQSLSKLFNQALKNTCAPYITLMNPEDYRSELTLQAQIEVLRLRSDIDIIYTNYYVSYDKNKPTEQADNWYLVDLPEFKPCLLYRDIPGPHTMWRRSVHDTCGYFDESFQFSYVWEFWNRCANHGAHFKKINAPAGTFFFNYFNQKKPLTNPKDYEKNYQEEYRIKQQYASLWTCVNAQEKSFVIITASYKNKDWYKRNLDSIFNQNYNNYRIIYIDDKSPDETGKFVQQYAQYMNKEDKIDVIINTENVGALANIYNAAHSCRPDEIILLVDGDDWLAHNDVLKYLNIVYQDPNVWLTYGQFQWFPAQIPGFVFEIPHWVIEENSIRSFRWVTTHLRTFYAGLFQKIKREDLLYNGKFCTMAWDLAIMYPMVEMAGYHTRFIPEILYMYNTANQLNDNKVNLDLQDAIDKFVRAKEHYKSIASYLY